MGWWLSLCKTEPPGWEFSPKWWLYKVNPSPKCNPKWILVSSAHAGTLLERAHRCQVSTFSLKSSDLLQEAIFFEVFFRLLKCDWNAEGCDVLTDILLMPLLLAYYPCVFGQCLLFLVEDDGKACPKKTCSFHLKNRNLKPGGNSLNYCIWVFGVRKRRLEDAKPLKALPFLQRRSGSKLPESELLQEDSSFGS